MKFVLLSLFIFWNLIFGVSTASAVVDPLVVPNNKCGVHIISATPDESSPAAQLANSTGGDWGYVTVLIEKKDRNRDKWQSFFNDLRKKHLIPLVRIATEPQGNYWQVPGSDEAKNWAEFLNNLNWPIKNRYVIIYNEPNQGQEWAGKVDAASYAQTLDQTISALKEKSEDFFVLNAGFDASSPQKPPLFQEESSYLKEMDQAVPGIFKRLDGWVSHSYPNPGFAGSPKDSGKGTVRTWEWEMSLLSQLGVTKTLPIFITETGWKHAEGIDFDKSLPSTDQVGSYFKEAFKSAWNSSQIIAVTPFLLNYQDAPFDHFSFKKPTGDSQNLKILGATYPEYYSHFEALLSIPKSAGKPVQEQKATLVKGALYPSVVTGESYTIPLTFKNTGQSIWNDSSKKIELRAISGGQDFGITPTELADPNKVAPGGEAEFKVSLKAPQSGNYKVILQLFADNKPFDQTPLEFNIQVKSSVSLLVNATLLWKKNFSGQYLLEIASDVLKTTTSVDLDENGRSEAFETKYLLPDYDFTFTLYRPFYKPKTIVAHLGSGINALNFGSLEPDFLSAIFKPQDFWDLLPFSK